MAARHGKLAVIEKKARQIVVAVEAESVDDVVSLCAEVSSLMIGYGTDFSDEIAEDAIIEKQINDREDAEHADPAIDVRSYE